MQTSVFFCKKLYRLFQYCFIPYSLQSVSHKMLKNIKSLHENASDLVRQSIGVDLVLSFLDVTSIRILHVITDLPKSVSQISMETKIPITTVYSKMRKLTGQRIIKVSGNINDLGRRHLQYQSKIDFVSLNNWIHMRNQKSVVPVIW